MKTPPEVLAERFYDLHQRQVFLRNTFAKTSLLSKVWKDLDARSRTEFIEAFRQLLALPEVKAILRSSLE